MVPGVHVLVQIIMVQTTVVDKNNNLAWGYSPGKALPHSGVGYKLLDFTEQAATFK